MGDYMRTKLQSEHCRRRDHWKDLRLKRPRSLRGHVAALEKEKKYIYIYSFKSTVLCISW